MLDGSEEAPRRRRVGFYLSTSLVGGAETLLRDLLWRLDAEKYELVVFYDQWPDLERHLSIRQSRPFSMSPVRIRGPYRVIRRGNSARGAGREPSERPAGGRGRALLTRLRALRDRAPFLKSASNRLLRLSEYAFWGWNKRLLKKALKQEPVDLLHVVNGGYPGALSAQAVTLAARRSHVPVCLMTVCSTPFPVGWPRPVERRIDEAVSASVDLFVVLADRPAAALVENRGVPESKTRVIHQGIDAPEPCSSEGARAARMQLGLSVDAPVVGIIGNFVPSKGQGLVVQALPYIRRRIPGVEALFVGEGPSRQEVERRAQFLGVSAISRFTGRVPDVFMALNALDVFVMPSEIEGLPYVLIEAMSQGKAIIASDVGGIPDAIIHGVTGLLIEPDVGAIQDAVVSVLEDRSLRARLGRAAHERYRELFSLSSMINEHEKLYDKLLSEN